MSLVEPFFLCSDGEMKRAIRLTRDHKKFDENYLQKLLEQYPELLPV